MNELDSERTATCFICGKPVAKGVLFAAIRPDIAGLILQDHPDVSADARICRDDLSRYRRRYLEGILADEGGRLSRLDREVIESLSSGQPVAQQPSEEEEKIATFGDRMADRVALFGGSWTFIIGFSVVLLLWMALNVTGLLFRAFDPYPFIFLNLVLSCVAAMQAPIIMMSQRRQETKDRFRAESDYRINLKAELEILALHQKIDHQWDQLLRIQRAQLELAEDDAAGR